METLGGKGMGYSIKNHGSKRYPHVLTDDKIEWKFCSGCFSFRQLDEFQKNINTWDGLTSRCRLCQNAYQISRRNGKIGENTVIMQPTVQNMYAIARKTFGEHFQLITVSKEEQKND